MTTTEAPTMQSEAERIAKGLNKAQREAILCGYWNVTHHRFKEAGITQGVCGLRFICELTPLGLEVRSILQRFPATESRGTPEV